MSFRDEARWWTVSPRTAAVIFAVPLVGSVLVALVVPAEPLYHVLVREDSVFEWIQVAGYAAAAVAAALAARRARGLQALALWALAIVCVFLLGEEVSWGQRIFGFGTPASVARANDQGEFNMHDLDDETTPFAVAQILVGLVGMTLPWFATRRWWVPPRFLSSAFAPLGVYWIVRLGFVPHPHYDFAKYSEWPETCFALAVALFAVLTLRRETAAAPAGAGAAREGLDVTPL